MRITARRVLLLCALLSVPVLAGTEADTPYTRIAKLASFLSQGDSAGALESFDRDMKDFGIIDRDLSALAAQAEILCSIDIVEDTEDAGVHHLDLDWYMQLKSRTDPGLIERRRQRIRVTVQKVTLQKTGATWRITSFAPEQILAPIAIR